MSYLDDIFGLSGKTVLVTGGGRGIGQILARAFAQAGATVAIFSRSGADETVKQIEELGGTAFSILCDVTEEAEVDAALNEVLQRTGSLDVVFNNAGVCLHKATLEASIEEWREIIDINLTGEYIVARAAGRIMIEKGIKGNIINMASMSGSCVNVPQWQASYNASKAGVIHMTRSLAVEWADTGVRVNSISPGYINTPMSADTPQELRDTWCDLIPMGCLGDPNSLIPTILAMASPWSTYVTGSDFIIDGGYSAR